MKRETAQKVRIKDILTHTYVTREGWESNYIEMGDKKISRIHVMGTVVSKEQGSIGIDDASGTIPLRFFEPLPFMPEVGDLIRCVGKPREYESQRCIVPEIVKKVEQPEWFEIWKKEALEIEKEETTKPVKGVGDDNLFAIIEQCDQGQGASVEEVLKQCKKPNAEKVLNRLLEEGEIFEIKKGFVKVLS